MTGVNADETNDTQPAAVGEEAESASEARAAQNDLTQSVGQRLTRESHDTHRPFWKRWLGKS